MYKDKKKATNFFLMFYILAFTVSVCGCSSEKVINDAGNTFYERAEDDVEESSSSYNDHMDSIYEDAMNRYMNPDDAEVMEGDDIFDKLTRKILSGYQRSYYTFRSLSPIIFISSLVIGILMMVLSRHNKQVKRMGLFVFIIGIPTIVLLIVFGVGIVNGIFLY